MRHLAKWHVAAENFADSVLGDLLRQTPRLAICGRQTVWVLPLDRFAGLGAGEQCKACLKLAG